ncbi:MAG: transposase [Nitrospirota bacterium]
MRGRHFIGLDTHCAFCEMAVVSEAGQVVKRQRCGTTIPELMEAIVSVPAPRYLVFEEGPLADWLYRNLRTQVDEIVVCEPRRNRLIAEDGDKDDPIDAPKLAQLYRGGYIKPVHHTESFERIVLKQMVGLYHDRVRNRVRQANRIMGQLRQHGVFVRESAFCEPKQRQALLERWTSDRTLRAALQLLWEGYELALRQADGMRRMMVRLARREEVIRRFIAVPGVHWIRAATFFAYVDTPWRFRSKSALWKYLGIGLQRRRSGEGPTAVFVPTDVNRILKCAVLGAAKSAIATKDNPFADQYARYVHEGLSLRNARRSVARSQTAVMWGMWKNGSVYRPEWVGRTGVGEAGASSSGPSSSSA